MIGKLTIDKASMNISYFLYSVLLVHQNGDRISRSDFVERMASFIGVSPIAEGVKENRTPYNKSKLPRYFGFIDIDSNSNLVITKRGKRLLDCISQDESLPSSERYYVNPRKRFLFIDLIFESVVFDSFGKNNCGAEQSNTDVDPPKVVFKTINTLGRATAEEICYVLYGLNNGLFDSFEDAIDRIQRNRNSGINDYSSVMTQWGVSNIVNDCKIINIFTEESIGLLELIHDEEAGRGYYQFSTVLSAEQKKLIEAIDVVYQPLRALFYSNTSSQSLANWIDEAVLGRVSDDSYVFAADSSTPLVGERPFNSENPGLFEMALKKAFENNKRNVFVVLENYSESEFPSSFQQYQKLFPIINDFKSEFHGWSKEAINDYDVYSFLIGNSSYAKKNLREGYVSIPSNIQIIGVMNMETSSNTDFDYGFKRVLVETAQDSRDDNKKTVDESCRIAGGTNILLYGVPGSGKSYTIEHELCRGVKKENRYRVVFHPEYMYSDFVGQILPKVIKNEENGKDEVSYRFVPGPFTNILDDAYHNPKEKYVLIIEELNRGNAPAIFGEIFQLLDRIGTNSTNNDNLKLGTSEYYINNEDIAGLVYKDKTHPVRIPSNLTILATMNTSDQNVFTLDTAFQRRWQMRQVENSFDRVSDSLANRTILDTTVKWKRFCQEINDQILINASEMSSTEDKRLGVYFVTEEDLSYNALDYSEEEYLSLCNNDYGNLSEPEKKRLDEITEARNQNRRFPEKVLKYLWDDAFKFNPDRLFRKELRSLEDVISGFLMNKGDARWDILNVTIKGNLMEDNKGRS